MYHRHMRRWMTAYGYLRFLLRHLPVPISLPLVHHDDDADRILTECEDSLRRVPSLLADLAFLGEELTIWLGTSASGLVLALRKLRRYQRDAGGGDPVVPVHQLGALDYQLRTTLEGARRAGEIMRQRRDTA